MSTPPATSSTVPLPPSSASPALAPPATPANVLPHITLREANDVDSDAEHDAERSVMLCHVGSLNTIAQGLMQDAQAEEDLTEEDHVPITLASYGEPYKLPLARLFNYQDRFWVTMVEKWGIRSLDKELEAYSIVDMDADGDYDPDSYPL
ncbi:uncharacterized protein PHACADRAFT_197584 [Phanerochaete carnosa HHB-10118-sp]|uniref:Uncharacterized protein n=1 Tax=Phanerochaete carnosa (strain HHB-10118-sp) TaxID=650164 RepID=K5UT79_PHACS|nr:uncharacterized protein PHACADRAFT_197584 [Phanerochaete carnosa HHB-10118-sp]EKM53156.1 hypothetical protein PHACADRAFT_197584 [Phanerochaete carnosa HHB-10118-sp]